MIRPVEVRYLLMSSGTSPLSTTYVSYILHHVSGNTIQHTRNLLALQLFRAIVDIQGASILKYNNYFVASWNGVQIHEEG